MDRFSTAQITKFFSFLDDMRKSGETNFIKCALSLRDNFDLSQRDMADVAIAWMETFSDGTLSPEQRAMNAKKRAA